MTIPANAESWHFVEPLMQPTNDACFPTALRILDRARGGKMGLGYGPGNSTLDRIFETEGGVRSIQLLTSAQAGQLATKAGFSWEYIDILPEEIYRTLQDIGPFCYVALYPPNPKYQHTLVIHSIKKKGGDWTIMYVDPALGKSVAKLWSALFLEFKPADTITGVNSPNGRMKIYYTVNS